MPLALSSRTPRSPARPGRRDKTGWALLAALLLAPATAMAQQNIGQMSSNLFQQFGPIADVLMGLAFLAGIFAGIKAGLTLIHHGKDPNNNPLKNAVVFIIASALLIGVPAVIMITQTSLFGSTANSTSLNAQSYQNLQ